jgi:hypothetical protein
MGEGRNPGHLAAAISPSGVIWPNRKGQPQRHKEHEAWRGIRPGEAGLPGRWGDAAVAWLHYSSRKRHRRPCAGGAMIGHYSHRDTDRPFLRLRSAGVAGGAAAPPARASSPTKPPAGVAAACPRRPRAMLRNRLAALKTGRYRTKTGQCTSNRLPPLFHPTLPRPVFVLPKGTVPFLWPPAAKIGTVPVFAAEAFSCVIAPQRPQEPGRPHRCRAGSPSKYGERTACSSGMNMIRYIRIGWGLGIRGLGIRADGQGGGRPRIDTEETRTKTNLFFRLPLVRPSFPSFRVQSVFIRGPAFGETGGTLISAYQR